MKNYYATTLQLECKIELPSLPNFIKATSYPGDNAIKEQSIDVADISETQLQEIASKWTSALIEHAKARRKAREEFASRPNEQTKR